MRNPLVAVAAVGALFGCLSLSSCATAESAAPGSTVVATTSFAPGSPMQRIQVAGSVRIGVSMDLPGLGNYQSGSASPTGFEITLARDLTAVLGLSPAQITWVRVSPADRSRYVTSGLVDLVISTYPIPAVADPAVEFAGPYLLSGQQFLVRRHSDTDDATDLDGSAACTVNSGSSGPAVASEVPAMTTTLATSYADCLHQLDSGSVQAVAGPGIILQGFANENADAYRVIGEPSTLERYGIAFPREAGMCQFLSDSLVELYKSGAWASAWKASLGHDALDAPTPPLPDKCGH